MFIVKVVKTDDEFKKYYHFRYKTMCYELKLIEPNTEEVDVDEYDKYSIHFVALDKNNSIVATTRMIYNSPIGLPTPTHMKVDFEGDNLSGANFCELSRVFVDKSVRGFSNTKEIMQKFVVAIYFYAQKYNINFFYAALEKNFYKFFKMINIDFKIVGEKAELYGLRYPCLTSTKGLTNKNPYLTKNKKI